jgi:hypothetical protein
LIENDIGRAIWGVWVPKALETGALKCVPPPLVIGDGLNAIQSALDRWREGVTWSKVVVELPEAND